MNSITTPPLQTPDEERPGLTISPSEAHRSGGQSGTMRAAVFGVNDGLLSNLSLIMGVAGANAQPKFVLLAGVTGLLAGAFSMAAGEYISMSAQRELAEREINLERRELAADAPGEQQELALIYQNKGLSPEDARQVAALLMTSPQIALDTHVREELGLNPQELGRRGARR